MGGLNGVGYVQANRARHSCWPVLKTARHHPCVPGGPLGRMHAEAIRVFETLEQSGAAVNFDALLHLITAYASVGRLEDVRRTVDRACWQPDTAYAAPGHGPRFGRAAESGGMHSPPMRPHMRTLHPVSVVRAVARRLTDGAFAAILRALRKAGTPGESASVWATAAHVRASAAPCPPRGPACVQPARRIDPRVCALRRPRAMTETNQAMERFLAAGGTPKAASFGALVQGLALEGRLEDAQRWRREMVQRGFALSADLYSAVRRQAGRWVALLAAPACAHSKAVVRARQPGSRTPHPQLIAAACKAGEHSQALAAFDEMEVKGLNSEPLAYGYAVVALCKQGMPSRTPTLGLHRWLHRHPQRPHAHASEDAPWLWTRGRGRTRQAGGGRAAGQPHAARFPARPMAPAHVRRPHSRSLPRTATARVRPPAARASLQGRGSPTAHDGALPGRERRHGARHLRRHARLWPASERANPQHAAERPSNGRPARASQCALRAGPRYAHAPTSQRPEARSPLIPRPAPLRAPAPVDPDHTQLSPSRTSTWSRSTPCWPCTPSLGTPRAVRA